jgi:hypothetical protein
VARLQKFVIWPARERPGRRQARLEHFGEIWQFRLPRRALGAGSAGRSRSKLSSILPQSGTNTGNPAQAILPARGHSYRLATHNRCERPRPDGRFRPTIKELNDKDEVLPGNIAARARDVCHGSGENDRTWRSVASIWNRRPRGRRSSLERCLHDRSWSKRMRRAHVDLWQLRRSRTKQECVLTSNGLIERCARLRSN